MERRAIVVGWAAAVALVSTAAWGAPTPDSTSAARAQGPASDERQVANAIGTVFAGHPRLIVGGYRGPSPDDLRAVCAAPEMQGECDRIGGRHVLDDSMSYLLTGDPGAAARAGEQLMKGVSCGNGYEVTAAGGYAIAYDWVWPTLSASDRSFVEGQLSTCGTAIAQSLRGNSPHLWHGFTSQAAALALIALAVDDADQATVLRRDAMELFRHDALEAYAVVGGAWPEGYNYERTHFFSGDPPYQYVMDALRAWHAAVERDSADHPSIFDTIAADEGDWLRGLGRHFVYGTLGPSEPGGKLTLMRGGDMPTGQAYPYKQYRPIVDAIAVAYDDDNLAAWGRALENDWQFVGGAGTYHSVHRYSLPYTLPAGAGQARPGDLPLGAIWGRDDLGYVITRSGWDQDATTIGYRAGKWFTGHQHMDQGHIDIWRRGPLAVDAGVYSAWGSDHRESFYSRTAAHNTLLVHMDGEVFEGHPGAARTNDDGQRIHTHNGRGCAQCMQSVEEWRSHIGDGMHFEAARIDAHEERDAFTVVASDLTAAYNSSLYSTPGNSPKLHLAQRDLVYARPSLLIAIDRVTTADGAGRPRFAMHFASRPEAEGLTVVEGQVDNGILVGAASSFAVTNDGGGRLSGSTLYPPMVETTVLGGPDYRYWVDGANRTGGAGGRESEPAEPGMWRIEVAPGGDAVNDPGGDGEGGMDWLLVHALSAVDSDAASEPVRLVEAAVDEAEPSPVIAVRQDRADGASVVVLASGDVPRQTVRFADVRLGPPARGSVLATGLAPNQVYGAVVDFDRVAPVVASAEGVVELSLPGAQRVALGICPPPDGAGDTWRGLCSESPTPGPTSGLALMPLGFAHR